MTNEKIAEDVIIATLDQALDEIERLRVENQRLRMKLNKTYKIIKESDKCPYYPDVPTNKICLPSLCEKCVLEFCEVGEK